MRIKRKLQNAKYSYLSFSGGKDSTAMLLRLLAQGIKIDKIVFADTGFEFPELYHYIDRISKHIKQKIIILKPKPFVAKQVMDENVRILEKAKKRGRKVLKPQYSNTWHDNPKMKKG